MVQVGLALGEETQRLAAINDQAARSHPGAGTALLPARAVLEGTAGRIHEVALVMFGQRGYHAVSVRDIAGEVGVKPSSIYAHVPSKQHILTALVRAGHEEHRDSLRASMLEAGSDPGEQLAALTRAHVLVHATYPLLTRVCNRELGSLGEDQRAEIMSLRLEAERLFLDVIERGQRLGDFGGTDPVLAVAAIGAMGMRVADWWHPAVGVEAGAVADTYAGFALRMVAP